MKQYLQGIALAQQALLGIGICILITLPLALLFIPDAVDPHTTILYDIVHITVFFVMVIRPLADILRGVPYIRPLVILRKGFGVVSASIVVSFILAKIMADPLGYFGSWFTLAYWSLAKYALLAHLADISAILLLVTSNALSKRLMGPWWKRVQKLAYVYFYASGLFVVLSYGDDLVVASLSIVTVLVLIAYLMNRARAQATTTSQSPASL